MLSPYDVDDDRHSRHSKQAILRSINPRNQEFAHSLSFNTQRLESKNMGKKRGAAPG